MQKATATLDTSFWINACRAGLLDLVEDLFRLVITYAVANEIRFQTRSLGVTPPDTELMERRLASGSLRLEEPRRASGLFGPGEAAAIGLAEGKGYFLLMDDGRPHQYARSAGIRVVGTPDLVVMLYEQRKMTLREARAMVGSLLGVSARIVGTAEELLEATARARGEAL